VKTEELRMTYVKELVDKGKKNGSLTYKEIMDTFEEVEMDPEQIDKLYEYLETKGIDVVGAIDNDMDIPPLDEDVEEVDLDISIP